MAEADPGGFTMFETAIGRCGIAWTGKGVLAVQLPESCDADTRARLVRRCPGVPEAAPPPEVARAIDGVAALLRGEAEDLTGVAVDMEGVAPFARSVYEIARAIPPGATLTYGDIASRLGAPGAARAVGRALGENPVPIVVPCHRVVAAGGKTGGFSARGGVATKLRLLSIEGAQRSLSLGGPQA